MSSSWARPREASAPSSKFSPGFRGPARIHRCHDPSRYGLPYELGRIFALAAFMALQALRIATSIMTIAVTVALAAMAVALPCLRRWGTVS